MNCVEKIYIRQSSVVGRRLSRSHLSFISHSSLGNDHREGMVGRDAPSRWMTTHRRGARRVDARPSSIDAMEIYPSCRASHRVRRTTTRLHARDANPSASSIAVSRSIRAIRAHRICNTYRDEAHRFTTRGTDGVFTGVLRRGAHRGGRALGLTRALRRGDDRGGGGRREGEHLRRVDK